MSVHNTITSSYFNYRYKARVKELGFILRFEYDIGETN